ncbi:MAG: hypothetical protein GX629_03465 [Phycisphaerae bacterium]|jgi:hypothetical protein|nr:hypothetical protein [Phycisphaerae bacterium]
MRNLLLLAMTGLLSIVLIGGCAATLSESSKNHTTRVERNMEKDCKLLVEDWDRFWMVDKPSRLTPNDM